MALFLGLWTVTLPSQSVMPVPRQQFLDGNGDPCAGCLLYAYTAGTLTPQDTYADVTLATPNANPVVLDSAGRATVFLDARLTYKFDLHTAADVPIWTVDSVDAVPSGLDVDVSGVAGETLAQRQIVYLSSGLDTTNAGEWYLADADLVSKSSGASLVGVVISPAITAGNAGTIRIQGRVTGYSGLSEGLSYFVSATAGALTNVAPTNVKVVGVAESPTVLLLTPSAASSGGVGTFSSLQVTSAAVNAIDTPGGIQAGRIQVTALPGGAAANTIGVNANQLSFLGGLSGHAFLNSGGGIQTSVSAGGAWTFSEGGTRALIVTRPSADAGIQIASTGGSGTTYGITSTTAGLLSIQHDVDANPRIELDGAANSLSLIATGGSTITGDLTVTGHIDSTSAVSYTSVSSVSVSADTNDWNPSGLSTARIIRIDASGGDGNHTITGLAAQSDGRLINLVVIAGQVTISGENASSTAANRFTQNCGMQAGSGFQQSCTYWYDGISQRWQKLQ